MPLISLAYFFLLSFFSSFLRRLRSACGACGKVVSRLELKITACMRFVRSLLILIPEDRCNLEGPFLPLAPRVTPCPVVGRFKFICTYSFEQKHGLKQAAQPLFFILGGTKSISIFRPPNLFLFLRILTDIRLLGVSERNPLYQVSASKYCGSTLLYSAVGISGFLFLYVWPFLRGDFLLAGIMVTCNRLDRLRAKRGGIERNGVI